MGYSKFLSCSVCGSQTRAAQAYHDQNLESSLGVVLICRFCLPGMLANMHVNVTIFSFLEIYHNFNMKRFLPVSIDVKVLLDYKCVIYSKFKENLKYTE